MTVISTKEMDAMRAIADDFFPDTCTIQTKTESAGATGGVSVSWADTYEDVACRLDPVQFGSEAERTAVGALQGQSAWTLNIPYDQAISIEDRVVHDSKTYEVVSVHDTQSYKTIRRALLTRADSG